jgi:hypothetical protein
MIHRLALEKSFLQLNRNYIQSSQPRPTSLSSAKSKKLCNIHATNKARFIRFIKRSPAFHVGEFIIYLRRSFLATIFPQGRRLKRAAPALYVVFCGGTKCPGGKHSVITGNNRGRRMLRSIPRIPRAGPRQTLLFHLAPTERT